jgi:MFS family permease
MAVAGARAVREALVPLWAESIGLTPAQTSLVFGIAGAVDMLLFYPSGWVMDHFGRVAVAVPSMLLLGLGMAVLPVTTSLVAVTAAAALLGFGNGIGSGLIMTLGADASPRDGRSQFLGGWRLMADVGRAAGPLALSAASAVMTLGASAVVLGALAAVGAGWLWIWVPRHDPTRSDSHGARLEP